MRLLSASPPHILTHSFSSSSFSSSSSSWPDGNTGNMYLSLTLNKKIPQNQLVWRTLLLSLQQSHRGELELVAILIIILRSEERKSEKLWKSKKETMKVKVWWILVLIDHFFVHSWKMEKSKSEEFWKCEEIWRRITWEEERPRPRSVVEQSVSSQPPNPLYALSKSILSENFSPISPTFEIHHSEIYNNNVNGYIYNSTYSEYFDISRKRTGRGCEWNR